MANTRTVGAAGKDHTTISSAVSWFQSNHDFDTDGIGTISIEDNAEYNENVSITGLSGTISSTAYLKITVAEANRHSGVAGTGHARVRGSSNGSHVFTVSEDFTVIEHLEIQQDSTGGSDEGIRVTSNIDDVLISRCIIWSDSAATDTDGVYAGNWGVSASVDNCIIYGFNRAGIHAQFYSGAGTQTWDIDNCTIYDCGADDSPGDGGIVNNTSAGGGATVVMNVYNTAVLDCNGVNAKDYASITGGTNTWTGTHNADTDGSLTTVGIATSAQQNLTTSDTTQSTGSYFVVNSLTAGSEDFLLLDDAAGNKAYGNATNRVGSEPDSRQDFSLDIAGNTRSTTSPSPDIGASEYTTGGAFTLTADSGTYSVTGTANSLILDALLTGASGSYAYTGTDASLITGYGLQADSGSYTYTGAAATLLADKILAASTGSYTYTGAAASLTRDGTLSADTGAYTYTGTAAALTFASAGSFTLTALTGAYSVSGTNVDLLRAATLGADSGAYSYTGAAVDFATGYGLTAESGSYSYAGTDVTFSTTIRLTAESGNFVYNGNNATLKASGQVWTVQTDSVTTWTDQADSTTIWNIQ